MSLHNSNITIANTAELEKLSYGQRYYAGIGTIAEDAEGFIFCASEEGCSQTEISLLMGDTHLQWFIPEGYVAPLEGRPYIPGILDCFTALKDYFSQTFGINFEHPDYPDEWWLSGKDLYLDNAAAAGFILNNGPVVVGDVLATKIHSTVVNHTSIYLGNNKVYHHLGYRKSVIEELKPLILNNLDSVWRHKDVL